MSETLALLDVLAIQMGCEYLSDLRFLGDGQRAALAHMLEGIPPGEVSLFQWNDTLEFFTGAPPEQTPEAARKRLMRLLNSTCGTQIDYPM